MTARTLLLPAFLLVATLALLVPPQARAGDDEPEGRRLFMEHGCKTCHSVAAVGIERMIKSDKVAGPDLSGVKVEDRDALVSFLRRERERDGRRHGKKITAPDEDLDAILDWLGGLPRQAD